MVFDVIQALALRYCKATGATCRQHFLISTETHQLRGTQRRPLLQSCLRDPALLGRSNLQICGGCMPQALLTSSLTALVTWQVNLAHGAASDQFGQLFAEELGLVLEVAPEHEEQVVQAYTDAGLAVQAIGTVTQDAQISISVNDELQISGTAMLVVCMHWLLQAMCSLAHSA